MLFHLCTDDILGWVRNASVIVNPLTSGERQQYAQAETCSLNQVTPMGSLICIYVSLDPLFFLLSSLSEKLKLTQIVEES